MNRILFVLPFLALLSACMAPAANSMPTPVVTEDSVLSATATPASLPATQSAPTQAVPSGKLPAAPFESRTYINDTVGFALDYPAGWTVNESVVGTRGSQVQFLSSPDLAEAATMPEGATRVSATAYQWDPKNDLAAFVANQKSAWIASGFTILDEEPLTLELGLAATEFAVQTPEANFIYVITAIGDQYLVFGGEGNLELVKEIVERVRPISP